MSGSHNATMGFLRRQMRRARGTLLAWSAAAVLFALAWKGAAHLGWMQSSALWAAVPAAAGAALLVLWGRRVWGLDTFALARECDLRWGLQGRMESAVELNGNPAPLAVAQRADAAEKLASKRPVGTAAWVSGIAVAAIGLGLVAAELAVLLERQRAQNRAAVTTGVGAAVRQAMAKPAAAQAGPKAQEAPPPRDVVGYWLAGQAAAAPIVSPTQVVQIVAAPLVAPAANKSSALRALLLKGRLLPLRASTPAGRLEALFQRQMENNLRFEQALAAGMSPAELRRLAEAQQLIAQPLQVLAQEQGSAELTTEVRALAAQSAAAAEVAAGQMEVGDAEAAREPAAAAEADLRKAVQVQDTDGRNAADAVLEQVRQRMNAADVIGNQQGQLALVDQARQQLRAEALRQQQQGSAEAAQKLVQVAGVLQNPGSTVSPAQQAQERQPGSQSQPGQQRQQNQSGQQGQQPGQQGQQQSSRGSDGSSSSGSNNGGSAPSGSLRSGVSTTDSGNWESQLAYAQYVIAPQDALGRAGRQLQIANEGLGQTNPNDVHAGYFPGNDLTLLVDAATVVGSAGYSPHDAHLANEISSMAREAIRSHHLPSDALASLLSDVRQLSDDLAKSLSGKKRDEWLREFNPEQVDPQYRKPVSDYFEDLSRGP